MAFLAFMSIVIKNNQNIFLKCLYTGFAADPHFILCLETKNEGRKFKPKRSPRRSAARQKFQQSGQASLRISALQHYSFGCSRLAGQRRRIESASPQCVRSKETKNLFRRFAFKPACGQAGTMCL